MSASEMSQDQIKKTFIPFPPTHAAIQSESFPACTGWRSHKAKNKDIYNNTYAVFIKSKEKKIFSTADLLLKFTMALPESVNCYKHHVLKNPFSKNWGKKEKKCI